jgi:hypothetical protein
LGPALALGLGAAAFLFGSFLLRAGLFFLGEIEKEVCLVTSHTKGGGVQSTVVLQVQRSFDKGSIGRCKSSANSVIILVLYISRLDTRSLRRPDTESDRKPGNGNWDVSRSEHFHGMSANAQRFNQPIGNWSVSRGEYFSRMFRKATTFDQDLSNWNVIDKETDDMYVVLADK